MIVFLKKHVSCINTESDPMKLLIISYLSTQKKVFLVKVTYFSHDVTETIDPCDKFKVVVRRFNI